MESCSLRTTQALYLSSNTVESDDFSIKGMARKGNSIYLDFQATTPVDPRVLDSMVQALFIFISLLMPSISSHS